MRVTHLAAMLVAAAISPVKAERLTQTLSATQTSGDLIPFDIRGAQFSPTLGSLVSVTGELTGLETTVVFRSLPPFSSTTLATRWFVLTPDGANSNASGGIFPDQTVAATTTSGGGTFTGAQTPVSVDFTFGDIADFVGTSSSALLLEFGMLGSTPGIYSPSGGASDLTTFNGTLALTYGFTTVPEPTSALMLGIGLLGAATIRWRRSLFRFGD